MELDFNYYEKENNRVSLANYLNFYEIHMILNNSVFDPCEFELYNYNQLIEIEKEEIKEEYKEEIIYNISEAIRESEIYNLWDDIEEIKEDVLFEFLQDKEEEIEERVFLIDVYQFYIINERDINFLMALGYPIYYNYDKDLYLLGVTHLGTGWDYVLTQINIVNNSIDTYQVGELLKKVREY